MKIYLLTEGEYSDYRVVAAYSTSEKAQAGLDAYRRGNPAGPKNYGAIEDYDLDPEVPKRRAVLAVDFLPSGDVVASAKVAEPDAMLDEYWAGRLGKCWAQPPGLRCVVEADDEAGAIKIASEKRTQWLAMKGVNRP